ncbi:MAG: hypothetical protein D6762_02980, partial [Candidatus Neomarinimicrobiota bacterium]
MRKILSVLFLCLVACGPSEEPEIVAPLPVVRCPRGQETRFLLANYFTRPPAQVVFPTLKQVDLRYADGTVFIRPGADTPALLDVPFQVDGERLDLMVRSLPMVPHRFRFRPEHPVHRVVVMGSFND